MGKLTEQIRADLTESMKARSAERTSTLRMLQAALKNEQINLGHELSDEEAMAVIRKGIKQRQDSIEQFTRGGRQELADKEANEIKIIESYLPKAAGEAEIVAAVRAKITEMGSPTIKEMGTVMKGVMSQFQAAGARVDGKMVSEIVKRELS